MTLGMIGRPGLSEPIHLVKNRGHIHMANGGLKTAATAATTPEPELSVHCFVSKYVAVRGNNKLTGKAAYSIPSYSTGSAGWGRMSLSVRPPCVGVIAVEPPTPLSAGGGVGEPGLQGQLREVRWRRL